MTIPLDSYIRSMDAIRFSDEARSRIECAIRDSVKEKDTSHVEPAPRQLNASVRPEPFIRDLKGDSRVGQLHD